MEGAVGTGLGGTKPGPTEIKGAVSLVGFGGLVAVERGGIFGAVWRDHLEGQKARGAGNQGGGQFGGFD